MASDLTPRDPEEPADEQTETRDPRIPEKLDLRSMDLTLEKKQELLRLFPREHLKLRPNEADKIHCGRKHFEELGVDFETAVSADEV